MSDASKRKEKQKWTIEKPEFDNARRLRGIYFIGPEDAEFTETIKNARRKLDVLLPAAMPCKIRGRKYSEICRTLDAPKTKSACIVEADESTRKGLEGTLHTIVMTILQGEGMNSNLVHKSIAVCQALTSSGGQRMGETCKDSGTAADEWKKQIRGDN